MAMSGANEIADMIMWMRRRDLEPTLKQFSLGTVSSGSNGDGNGGGNSGDNGVNNPRAVL